MVMAWQLVVLILFGILVALMVTGMPIAFAFMLTCIVGAFLFWGGLTGLEQLAVSYFSSVSVFVFLPLPLFILMGSIIFESGVGINLVNAVDKLLGRLPGRISVLSVMAGVLLGTVIGVSGGTIALLGKVLVPEMVNRGYHKSMSVGPIVGSGLLAVLIPPSGLAVFLGAIGRISIGQLLLAIITPGLLMAVLFLTYIIGRCAMRPSLAPTYAVSSVPWSEKVGAVVHHILPISIVIFAVIGVVFLGIATPAEAAAFGAIACYLLAIISGRFNWKMVKNSAMQTVQVSVMMFVLLVSAISFSRILATSGAMASIITLATTLPVAPIFIIIMTQIVVLFLGCFMDPGSVIMVSAPVFMPIAIALGYDPVWYGVIMLINVQLGLITPPFGLDCYIMKALAPKDVSLADVFISTLPFFIMGIICMVLIMVLPQIALWLPALAR